MKGEKDLDIGLLEGFSKGRRDGGSKDGGSNW